jgi:hypothetical protein
LVQFWYSSTTPAVFGGFLRLRFVSGLPERAIFFFTDTHEGLPEQFSRFISEGTRESLDKLDRVLVGVAV